MEIDTSRIDLENGKILHEGAWLTADDLKDKIQEKMTSGDMKFARLAGLLEELNTAIESSQILEVKIVLSKDQYDKLSMLSDGNINDCVHKAVLAFLEEENTDSAASPEVEFVIKNEDMEASKPARGAGKGKKTVINCSKCNAPIEIDMEDMPSEVKCQNCNARGILKTNKNKPRFKDHYIG